jgi:acyl dehydratase
MDTSQNRVVFPVERGHIMMFARAIGDDNPIYYSTDYAAPTECGTVIAPPTFVQASAHFNPERWLSASDGRPGLVPRARADVAQAPAAAVGGARLHGEQHYEYHRPVRYGDELQATTRPGRTWTKASSRSGALRFSETITEFRDAAGELVVTARSVSVQTGLVPAKAGE